MGPKHGKCMDKPAVAILCLGESTDNPPVEPRIGPQQMSMLEGYLFNLNRYRLRPAESAYFSRHIGSKDGKNARLPQKIGKKLQKLSEPKELGQPSKGLTQILKLILDLQKASHKF